MLKRYLPQGLLLMIGLVIGSVLQPLALFSAQAQGGCQTFSQTGKQVCGRFLQYWQQNGGLAQQGLPLTGEFTEVSDLNGQSYTVQYFERAVFEKHPENAPPYDVLLSQLGTFRFKNKYPSGEPSTGPYVATASVDNAMPIQGASVRVTGTLMQAGSPIKDAIMNTSWRYQSTSITCDGARTNSDGVAVCANNIGNATPGFTVVITVTFLVNGR